jgi:hypothetical protein
MVLLYACCMPVVPFSILLTNAQKNCTNQFVLGCVVYCRAENW